MRKINTQKGFTLYELVVVAGIILLLTSIILARLDISREKARDTKKVSELKSLQTALELYQLSAGEYPTPSTQPAKNTRDGENSMTTVLTPIVAAKYISAIPNPPKGTTVATGDTYYYQTEDYEDSEESPSCDGKTLNEVPYIIYFVTEQPRDLPKLEIEGVEITNGYCLTL